MGILRLGGDDFFRKVVSAKRSSFGSDVDELAPAVFYEFFQNGHQFLFRGLCSACESPHWHWSSVVGFLPSGKRIKYSSLQTRGTGG